MCSFGSCRSVNCHVAHCCLQLRLVYYLEADGKFTERVVLKRQKEGIVFKSRTGMAPALVRFGQFVTDSGGY